MKAFRPEKDRAYKVRLFRPRPFIKNDWSDGKFFCALPPTKPQNWYFV